MSGKQKLDEVIEMIDCYEKHMNDRNYEGKCTLTYIVYNIYNDERKCGLHIHLCSSMG